MFKSSFKKKRNKLLIIEIVSLAFVFLFLYTACDKINNFDEFQVQLGKSPILYKYVTIISIVVPTTEIIISILLMTKRFQLVGLYMSFCIMIMFSTYIVLLLNFSSYIPCSCGGVLESLTWEQHLIFNVGFATLALVGVFLFPYHDTYCNKQGKPCTL